MSQTAQALKHGGSLPPPRIVDTIAVRFNGALKISQAFLRAGPPPAPAELQEDIALGVGVKPQVTRDRFAFDLWIEHLDGRLIDLQVAGGLERLPNAVREGQQEQGDLLDPLHHLLARDDDPMALAKNPFQRVISEMVVKAAPQ